MHLAVKVRLTVVTTIAIAVSVTACASTPESPAPSGGASPSNASSPPAVLRPLPTDGIVDYQLGGAYDPPDGTTIVARDSTEQPAAVLYSICYLNGFQTQPQDADWWRASHPDLLLSDFSIPQRIRRAQSFVPSSTNGSQGAQRRASTPSSSTISTPTLGHTMPSRSTTTLHSQPRSSVTHIPWASVPHRRTQLSSRNAVATKWVLILLSQKSANGTTSAASTPMSTGPT
jgi:hypothetical protein